MNRLRYVGVRILQTVPVLFGVSVVVFVIIHSAPGDPIVNLLGIEATEENVERLRRQYGLDQPLYVQYGKWLFGVLQGDLGRSLTQSRSVASLVASRLPATLFLAVSSMVVAVAIAVPAGVVGAAKKGTLSDYAVTTAALAGISVPNFWLGLVLILVFARSLGVLPPGNYVSPLENPVAALRHVAMPAITVGTAFAALLARQTRSSMLDALSREHVRMAKSKGLPARTVFVRHALKGALLPVVTVAGLQFGYLLSATVVVEQVFAWPGMGRLIWLAVRQQDYPTVQGTVLVVATLFVLVNLVVDLAYAYLDPRVGTRGESG
ncbi:ABC transporter permease [Salinigranum salinum]|uniref:ABC transporter permease n=1 Tax=Salinigranum salinum TaxID=1364937 RepID=UPI0012604616|nr:ABC transporter permease [Salinigranum salinum]